MDARKNFIQKVKRQAKIWYLTLSEYAEFSGGVHFFYFRLEIPFLGKFCPKNQNCHINLKFGT